MTTVHSDVSELVVRADALERDGRLRAAIDVLCEANRLQRDIEIERRLVRLRHDAFAEIDRSQALATWPPTIPDHDPPDELGPLTLSSPRELTLDTLRHGIYRYGSVHVRGAIPPDRVARLVECIDRAFDGYDAHAAGAPASETTPWFEPFNAPEVAEPGIRRRWTRDASGIQVADSPRALFELLDTLEAVGFRDLVADHLGEPAVLSMAKCVLRRVSLDTVPSWHQDGAFLGDDLRAVNVWITLTDCGRDAPGLDLVGRRFDHVVETGTEGAAFDTFAGQAVVERVAPGAIVRPTFAAGDILIFDELLLHRSAVDPSMTRERHAIETWFFAPSRYPEELVPLVF